MPHDRTEQDKERKRIMNILTMEHITKSYTDRVLLDDAAFCVDEREKIGVIGINGMGKSTLLKIAAGIEDCDAGKISKGSQAKISYLPQTPVFADGITILEAVLEGNIEDADEQERWGVEAEAKSMLNRLGFTDYHEQIGHMSGGQKKRAALVQVLLSSADILVLDEPTNHLDHAMSEWLEEYLIQFRGAVLLVTHDRYFLDRIVDRIVEVDQGKLYHYPGNYSEYIRLKEERQDMALASERKRKSLLRTELKWLGRGARARSTKQKAHIDRIKAMQEVQDIQEERRVLLDSVASRMGSKTIELSEICKSYGERALIKDYSYTFLKDDRIGIIGPNGCGKSTLLKIIHGDIQPDNGCIETGQTIRIGYFSQENEAMDGSMKVIDYVKEAGEYIATTDGRITASQMLENFLFDGAMQWSKIEKLSGGERRRLYLMRVLMEAPNVLLLDEPTNDLDIQTLRILEDYLDRFHGIIVAVSHDRYFLDRTVNRIFSFEGGGRIRQSEGGYSDYLIRRELEALPEEKRQSIKTEPGEKEEKGTKNPWKQHEKKLKFTFKEQKEFERIDDEIAGIEEQIGLLDIQIMENAVNSARLNELMKEKEEKEEILEEKMERWVYLNDLNDRIQKEKDVKEI
jgi:ATP-binding cassette subfamily F protein uup